MAKIVIDARESGTTTGRYVDKLVEYLQIVDRQNSYVVLYKKARINEVNLTAPNFAKREANYKEFSLSEQLGFAWLLYRLRADLVHFPAAHHPVLYFKKIVVSILDLTTLRFRNPAKNKLVFWVKQRIYWLVVFLAAHRSKHVITISNYVQKDISKHFKVLSAKFTTTHNSADAIIDPSEPVESLENTEFILYVGRHQPHKNLPRLIKAYESLLTSNPSLKLVIVGKMDSASEKLKSEFSHLKGLHFTGFVSEGQLRWLYENTACYVFPSMSEGFGLPGLEAMKHGAPVASSNATCLPEIYGNAAKYFSPYSVKEIEEAVGEILSSKKLRAELKAKGKKQVAKYSWKRMAEQTLEVYEQVLGKKK